MQVPMEITFRGVEKTDEAEALIRRKAEKLEQVCDHIISLKVAVENDQKHQDRGSPVRVRLDLLVPPKHEIAVRRESSGGYVYEELPQVIRDAFDAARRQVKKLNEKQNREVKTHEGQQAQALVKELFPDQDYGFAKTLDTGRDVYFHRNAVSGDFDDLVVGASVHLMTEVGENGLQATVVRLVDRSGA